MAASHFAWWLIQKNCMNEFAYNCTNRTSFFAVNRLPCIISHCFHFHAGIRQTSVEYLVRRNFEFSWPNGASRLSEGAQCHRQLTKANADNDFYNNNKNDCVSSGSFYLRTSFVRNNFYCTSGLTGWVLKVSEINSGFDKTRVKATAEKQPNRIKVHADLNHHRAKNDNWFDCCHCWRILRMALKNEKKRKEKIYSASWNHHLTF